mmetsp:Transcript_5530/g.11277  ORF Transcript_5530/g.11277 Transcript_5530/m.11277 type:complete len:286 (-) Transcript_5530:161-1018(-)
MGLLLFREAFSRTGWLWIWSASNSIGTGPSNATISAKRASRGAADCIRFSKPSTPADSRGAGSPYTTWATDRSVTTTASNPDTITGSAPGSFDGFTARLHFPSASALGFVKPVTFVRFRTSKPCIDCKCLHTEFMPGIPTYRLSCSLSSVTAVLSVSSGCRCPLVLSSFGIDPNRPSHLPTTPALSHSCTRLSNRGSLTEKNCAPWSKVTCVPSSRSYLRVDMRPPKPLPDSNTTTSKSCLVSSLAHTVPEIPPPTTATLLLPMLSGDAMGGVEIAFAVHSNEAL